MKWGVRRSQEELKHNPESIRASINRTLAKSKIVTPNGVHVREISEHTLVRAKERGLTAKGIMDAMLKPIFIDPKIRYDYEGKPSYRLIGMETTININPNNGRITTIWKTGTSYKRRYGGKK